MRIAAIGSAALLAGACASQPAPVSQADLAREVADTERAFARTMATRDHAAFTTFLAPDAIFVSEPKTLRGSAEVAVAWKRYFERSAAPFSWEPAQVEVLDSGTLALSTGPVRNAEGKLIAMFTSIWRRESPGVWRIVFDKGSEVCDCR